MFGAHKMKQTRVTNDGATLNLEVPISLSSPLAFLPLAFQRRGARLGEFERDRLFLKLYHWLQNNRKS